MRMHNKDNMGPGPGGGLVLVLAVILFMAMCGPSQATSIEPYLAVGKVVTKDPNGVVTLGLRGRKYDVAVHHFSEAHIYNGTTKIPAHQLLTLSRHWEWQETPFLGGYPTALLGVGLKGADRCKRNHEADCNRRLPLPFSFHFGLGVTWDQLRIELYHDSNNNMDYGEERKNQGVNWLSIVYRVR